MIILIIFILHALFVGYIFIKKSKHESLGSAFQNTIFIVIIFSVGWTILTLLLNLFVEPQGLGSLVLKEFWGTKDQIISFDRDTITLTILTIVEFFFFRGYYRELFISNGKEKQ